jgi:hypothetical protein
MLTSGPNGARRSAITVAEARRRKKDKNYRLCGMSWHLSPTA